MEKFSFIKLYDVLGNSIRQSRPGEAFKRKFPRLFQFISDRLSLHHFKGIPLTIFALVIFFNLLLLAEATEEMINSEVFIFIDNLIAEQLYDIRSEALARFFYFFTQSCHFITVMILGVIIGILLLFKNQFHFISGVFISIGGSAITVFLGKNIFETDRPHQFAFYEEASFGFPSGHTTLAVAFYGFLFYLLGRNFISPQKLRYLIAAGLLFIGLIGFSRLYLGVHYLSDVIGGYLLGSLWLLFSIAVTEWRLSKFNHGVK